MRACCGACPQQLTLVGSWRLNRRIFETNVETQLAPSHTPHNRLATLCDQFDIEPDNAPNMITSDFDLLTSVKCDVCIVGTGPVGASLAVDLKRRGLSVFMLESGLAKVDRKIQSLSDVFIASPQAHHQMDAAVCRSLGGTSRLWGGRCTFLDEIDFQKREYIPNSGWPISYDDVARHLDGAAQLLGCDDGNFEADEWISTNDADIDLRHIERWVNETRSFRQLPDLAGDGIKILLNATVVGIDVVPGTQVIRGLHVEREGRKATFRGATYYVLAMGGIETARLLMNVQTMHTRLFGGCTGPLGRNYMGHLSGSIACIHFFKPDIARKFANIEGRRSFGRRRLALTSGSQREHRLPNIGFWPDNATYFDPLHSSGMLSAVFLTLSLPGIRNIVPHAIRQSLKIEFRNIWPHLGNIVRDMPRTLAGLAEISRQRLLFERRLPRLFVYNQQGVYPLRFHAEQSPSAQNRIRLSSDTDWLGVPRAIVEFSYSIEDMRRVIEAHTILDRSLRRLGIGELIYDDAESLLDPVEQLQKLAPDGLHQIGLTRMADTASAGVVDANCRIFEFQNLFIAGSSTFPTSGQAAPTLPSVALAVRLSEHIANASSRRSEVEIVGESRTLTPLLRHSADDQFGQGRKLNILFVTASYYPAVRYGGPIYTVHSLARHLAELGNRVVVYTTNVDGDGYIEIPPEDSKLLDGVEVRYFKTAINKIYWSQDMIRALNRNVGNFDIVHAHAGFIFPTIAARRAARRAGVPFVYSPRGMLVLDLIKRKNFISKTLWCLLFEIANCRAASFIHATSHLEADEIGNLKLRRNKIEVIPNGVEPFPDHEEPPIGSAATSPNALAPYVLVLGRVSWKKGLDRLICAMSFVPSVNLVIVGNDEEKYTSVLRSLARKSGVEDRVVFAGPAYGSDKIAWLRGAELFVLSSYSESFGVVVLEAMACGCPVIMTPEVGIAEDIQKTGAGIVVEGSPEKIGAAINALLADPDRSKQLGERGRVVVRDMYSWPKIAAEMESAYLAVSTTRAQRLAPQQNHHSE